MIKMKQMAFKLEKSFIMIKTLQKQNTSKNQCIDKLGLEL